MIHNENGEETVWVFDGRIGHLDKYVRILLEVDHELLLLLHVAELVLVNTVRVVEKQVVLAGQLYLHLVDLILTGTIQEKYFDPDGLECTDLLWSLTWILDSKLKRRLAVKHHRMSLSYTNRSSELDTHSGTTLITILTK